MFKKMADNQNHASLSVQFRKRRFAFFLSLLSRLKQPIRILDIGGTESYWKMMGMGSENQIHITLLNLTKNVVTLPNLVSVAGDARKIQLEDSSFDVVFSNSVIEHVGRYEDQLSMAREVARVGRCYFIQTPNRYFPLEPHFLFPFFQFFPSSVRAFLLQNFRLGWMEKTPDPKKARALVDGIRLLSKREFKSLFPQASIFEEKVFGIAKSFIAYGGWDEAAG